MTGSRAVVETLADLLGALSPDVPVVLDPVMVASSNDSLLEDGSLHVMRDRLFGHLALLTPNIPEAAAILRCQPARTSSQMQEQAEKIFQLGPKSVLLKGGHLAGDIAEDVLFDGKDFTSYKTAKIKTRNTHGTGCTLSAAITAHLAKGAELQAAISMAKKYTTDAIRNAVSCKIGKGNGPLVAVLDCS
jgi:hydroxymethylpyrimidine/phosphomethylpyrimidine kinase